MQFIIIALIAFFPSFSWAADAVNISIGGNSGGEGGGSLSSSLLQIIAVVTILSLAPSILIMTTSFTRIVVVLSMLRSAIGLQQTPPNTVLVSLALFLTLFIMQPVFDAAYDNAIKPLMEEKITEEEAYTKGVEPFKAFMIKHTRTKDLQLFAEMSGEKEFEKVEDTPLKIVIPAFIISELKRAFEIGFLLFVPFLIIDMLVASILMAMGMMMLPPVVVSLPFKIIFFVLVDGWYMVAGSLIQSYGS